MPILSPDLGPTRGFTVVRIPLDVDTYDYTGKFTLPFLLLLEIILNYFVPAAWPDKWAGRLLEEYWKDRYGRPWHPFFVRVSRVSLNLMFLLLSFFVFIHCL